MSTRAVYTIKDESGDKFSVYGHYDGYPSGAAEHISAALAYAWPGARFEAMDFAAALIAANKTKGGGGWYITKSQSAHGDLEYDYLITSRYGVINVAVYSHEWNEEKGASRRRIWSGPLKAFIADAANM